MIAVGLMLLGEREEFVAVSHDPIVSIGILRQDLSEIRSVMLLVAVNDCFRISLVDAGFLGAARTRTCFSGRIMNANSIVIKNDAKIRVCKIHIRSVGIAVQFQIFTTEPKLDDQHIPAVDHPDFFNVLVGADNELIVGMSLTMLETVPDRTMQKWILLVASRSNQAHPLGEFSLPLLLRYAFGNQTGRNPPLHHFNRRGLAGLDVVEDVLDRLIAHSAVDLSKAHLTQIFIQARGFAADILERELHDRLPAETMPQVLSKPADGFGMTSKGIEIFLRCRCCVDDAVDVLSAVNDGDSLLCQQHALLITSVDSCC